MSADVDFSTISELTEAVLRTLPPRPVILSQDWRPPKESEFYTQGTIKDRLKIFADADSHDWTDYLLDTPDPTGNHLSVMAYWDGKPEAQYTLTGQSYWILVPQSYTQVLPGNEYKNSYMSSIGVSDAQSSTFSAELGVDIKGLSAKISAAFTHTVTVDSLKTISQEYTVKAPTEGNVRVWMLWQLCDQIIALDGNGKLIINETRRADVNWSQHRPSGAFVNYKNLQQIYPSDIFVPVQQDFPLT
ncbi:hypothetical protein [Massilia antarctica]|uniref:hypothetical protein n=1 Tax=Massilia antarctica TaxID=2765360 RepID=UPI0035E9DC52